MYCVFFCFFCFFCLFFCWGRGDFGLRVVCFVYLFCFVCGVLGGFWAGFLCCYFIFYCCFFFGGGGGKGLGVGVALFFVDCFLIVVVFFCNEIN